MIKATEIMGYVDQNNIDAISDLIIKGGFDVNLQTEEDGKTLLMQAAYLGYEQMVLLLLKHAADVTLKDKNSETASQKCRRAKLFYEFCPDYSKKTKNLRNIIKHLNEANYFFN